MPIERHISFSRGGFPQVETGRVETQVRREGCLDEGSDVWSLVIRRRHQ